MKLKSTRSKASSRKSAPDEWGSSRSSKVQPLRSSRSSIREEPAFSPPPRRRTTRKKKYSPTRFSLLENISPERRMDLLGVVLAIGGVLTALTLFSSEGGLLDRYWVNPLTQIFGWGIYLLTLALIVLGIWLVARNVERLPRLTVERVIGILILGGGILVSLHSLAGPAATALPRAEAGTGGGYIGYLFQNLLVRGFGRGGHSHRPRRLADRRACHDPRYLPGGDVPLGGCAAA